MRNKTTAGLFALFLGWAGIHRFYLGQIGLGILYFFMMFFGVSFILGIIDAIVFFGMDEEEFNKKYNSGKQGMAAAMGNRGRYGPTHKRNTPPPVVRNTATKDVQSQHKVSGIKKYKEFDLEGAIEDFKKGLDINPRDISLHFNLACAYSLTEQVDKAYAHIDKAVAFGFNDFEKIKTHDDLAYVRIQDRFDEFQENGYRLKTSAIEEPPQIKEVREEEIKDDVLLAQFEAFIRVAGQGFVVRTGVYD